MESHLDTHTAPRLILFLSVDLVGSTAFKSLSAAGEYQPWLDLFWGFYRDLPAELLRCYDPAKPEQQRPWVWKSLGDELIFAVELGLHYEAARHLLCFRNAIRQYRATVKRVSPRLDLKAVAWLAEFPVLNSVIVLPSPRGGQPTLDFIGPSIDTGFRLAKAATPRRLVLSIELANLLSRTSAGHLDGLALYFDRGMELKGVLNGRPYPLVWTDLHAPDEIERLEDELAGRREPVRADTLMSYSQQFITTLGLPLFEPFFPDDADGQFSQKPEWWIKGNGRIRARWNSLYEANQSIHPPGEARPRGNAAELARDIFGKLPPGKTAANLQIIPKKPGRKTKSPAKQP